MSKPKKLHYKEACKPSPKPSLQNHSRSGKGRDRDRTRAGRKEQGKRVKQQNEHLQDMREALTALHTMARIVEKTSK